MNLEATKLVEAREQEVARLGGLAAYRLQALQNLKLKTVVKESHASSVHTLVVNHTAEDLGNLFATVGKDQATVYDDDHMGDHVAVVAHFTNAPTDHAPGGELAAATWLSADGWTDQPAGDACVAVAGADPNISVISVAEARVVRLLRGHTEEVAELAAAGAGAPRLLASLSRDGNLRLWDVPTETCLSSVQHLDATCIAMAPDGRSMVVGGSRGRLQQYDIVAAEPATGAAEQPAAHQEQREQQGAPAARIDEGSRRDLVRLDSSHSDTVDCLRFLPGGRLASKSNDGRMCVWQCKDSSSGGGGGGGNNGSSSSSSTELEALASWKIPHCSSSGGWASRCQFGATRDGRYIAAGNSRGDCYVFDAESGERVGYVSAIRVSAPVRACGLSEDCRHLLAVLGKGFIFRFEYHGPLAAPEQSGEEGEQESKENTNAEQQEAAAP